MLIVSSKAKTLTGLHLMNNLKLNSVHLNYCVADSLIQ